jgi:hypothetical protein
LANDGLLFLIQQLLQEEVLGDPIQTEQLCATFYCMISGIEYKDLENSE